MDVSYITCYNQLHMLIIACSGIFWSSEGDYGQCLYYYLNCLNSLVHSFYLDKGLSTQKHSPFVTQMKKLVRRFADSKFHLASFTISNLLYMCILHSNCSLLRSFPNNKKTRL